MKITRLFLISILLLFTLHSATLSQNVVLHQTNESGIYRKGEKIKIEVVTTQFETDSLLVRTRLNYGKTAKEWRKYSGDSLVVFEGSFEKPAAFIIEVEANGEKASTGFVVEPEKFEPATKRPKDFNKYWNNEKKRLRSLPIDVKSEPVKPSEAGFICFDVEINCTGPKPARGYFAKPESAKPGSLPIVLNVHAAGVKGSWCLSKPETALRYAKMGNGALSFDLNAHGMLNGQSQEYYNNLENGELKNYWAIGLDNRSENYFRGMYLRLMRTLDFLCRQPEWDGKRIIVIGESQGGGQALVAAGLDHRVTAAVATVPAMCDFGRTLKGEQGGWPNPFGYQTNKQEMMKTLPYFDAAHILKNSKATLVTEIGFIDVTCPSSSVYAAVNQAKGKKMYIWRAIPGPSR